MKWLTDWKSRNTVDEFIGQMPNAGKMLGKCIKLRLSPGTLPRIILGELTDPVDGWKGPIYEGMEREPTSRGMEEGRKEKKGVILSQQWKYTKICRETKKKKID